MDLTHVIMEQAMKFGRVVTFKAADALATAPAGVATPQFVHIELRPAAGGAGQTVMVPTHATNGRQLEDKDWIHFIRDMASRMKD